MNSTQSKTVGAAGAAGAITTLIIAGLKHFGLTVEPDVAAAILTLVMAGSGLLVHRGVPNA